MKRVRGLSNENYRERKEAISRTLKAVYDGDAAELHRAYDHVAKEPVPQDMLDLLEGLE